jgi:hypothetical protein
MISTVRSNNSIRVTRSEGGTGGNIHEWERWEHGFASAGEGVHGGSPRVEHGEGEHRGAGQGWGRRAGWRRRAGGDGLDISSMNQQCMSNLYSMHVRVRSF